MDMTVTTNRLLPGIEHRPTELGRIRLGDKSVTDKGKEYPVKLETWRLTSGNRAALDAAAAIYGGTVEAWADGPNEGYFELLTDSATLQVLIPRDLQTLSQWYEFWQGGTCERRCDGTIEQLSQMPCLCKAEGGDMTCRPRTRLNIMLPDVPGLGVWRLETDGWNAATSLPATIEMLLSLSVQPWVKAVLRLEQRSAKKRQADGKVITHRFAVPVLDTPDDLTLGRIVGNRLRQDQPQLPEATQQPTARERIAAQRAELEAQTTSGRDAAGTAGATSAGPDTAAVERTTDEPPYPAETIAGVPPRGRAVSGQEGEADDSSSPAPAGARTATSEGTPSTAEAGNPEPAPDEGPGAGSSLSPASGPHHDDSGAAPLAPESSSMPPPPETARAVCGDDGGKMGRCQRAPGHTRKHQGPGGEWPQERGR